MTKRKEHRRGKKRQADQASRDGFQLYRHPFSEIEPAIIRAALLKRADQKIAEFPELITSMLQIFREKYPPHILAVLAGYGLQVGVSDEGVGKRLTSNVEQHHVELLQALALSLRPEEWGEAPASPEDIQKTIDGVAELADAFHYRRFKAVEHESDSQARTALALQEQLRLHTQIVRNWGYFSEVVAISSELYAPFDTSFRTAFGFSASELIGTTRHLVALLEGRSNQRFTRLKRVFREKTVPRLVRAYYKQHPDIKGEADEFLKAIPSEATREQVAYRLLAHADLSLVEVMHFTPDMVAQESGLTIKATQNVLAALSLRAGSLSGDDPEHFFMGNPVWRRPCIEIGGTYFCPAPQSIFSHIHEIMRSLAETAGVQGQIADRRAAYLEAKVEAMLGMALPTAELRHGVEWHVDGVKYETDHVAMIDRNVIIVEDKSAALTASGLRGAPDRARRHVNDLLVAPSIQSSRLEKLIRQVKAGDTKAIESLKPFDLNFANMERVVRISVTLDDFSILASAERDLKDAGWIPRDLALAPTLNIADLQAVVHILGSPPFFLHYFAERERVQKAMRIFADEMDYLGCYLETGFNLNSVEATEGSLALVGMSASIDRYYNSRDAGVRLEKPKPKLGSYFSLLIEAIERRAFPRWSVITTDLLRCANFKEQQRIDSSLVKLKSRVERNWRDPDHECSLVVSPPKIRDTAVVFYAYPPQLALRRSSIAEELASKALALSGRDRCVMICRNTARWKEPYASIYIVDASKNENGAAARTPEVRR